MNSIVILISGRGSNMEAIVKAHLAQRWPVKIAAVIANRPDAAGLEFAAAYGIPTRVVNHREYTTREAFDERLAQVIDEFDPVLVVLAGFMRILTGGFVNHYAGRLLNIHPSLLPLFPGLHTHEQALEARSKRHGATVHFVTEALDHGPIVIQASVPVLEGDTPDSLAARVLRQEHVIYPRAVRWFVDNRLSIEGDRVVVTPSEPQLIESLEH